MGLPKKIRDKIINFILPINQRRQEGTSAAGSSDVEENLPGRPFHCNYIHPLLWTCRQLRYEYGQLFCMQPVPSTWPQEMP